MGLRFEDDFLKKLEHLQLVSNRAFAGQSQSERRARTRGRGMEFADHRGYTPGDDFRHVDWKAYKRLNRLLVRLFDEEQHLPVYLFVDASASMASSGKFDQAQRLAAALCYIGLAHLERVSILPFAEDLGREISPGQGKGRIFSVFEHLERLEARGVTRLHAAFAQFASRRRPRGMAVVISDFLDPEGFERGLTLLRAAGHDVFAVQVSAPCDRRCDCTGEMRLVDGETGEMRDVEVTPALADAYARAWVTHSENLQAFCARTGAGYVRADAERPFETIVLQAFRAGRFVA